ncbi:hypothetical protein, partial [Limosilactobacillus ingluviei]|uniref:DUF1659 domain-containing protein n=1 Tax=Limosilactobacillus ingluviei TaxID=148604 RepID=UPI000704FF8B
VYHKWLFYFSNLILQTASNKLQFIGTSEHHPDGYRRNFNNVVKDPAPAAVEGFAAALASLTGEQISDGILTTALDLTLA